MASNNFSHHCLPYAEVKITRRGARTRYEFDASPANRIVIEVHKGGLTIVDEEAAAIARGHTHTGRNPADD